LFGFGIQTTNKDVAINTQGGVGTSAMIIKKSNGNIGMGTMTPTEKLEVVGNIKASLGGNISTTGNSTSTQLTVGGNSSSAIKARINGNVGNGSGQANGLFLDALPNAGTTSYYQINSSVSTLVPSTLVSVYGSARNGSSVTVGVQGVISGGMGQASSNFTAAIRGENTANLGNTHYGGYFTNNTSVIGATVYGVRGQIATVAANQTRYGSYFDVSGSGTNTLNIGLYATATGATNNYAAIFDQGNVGIGTTTPTQKLDIVGNALITSSSGNALKVATGSEPNALTIQSNGRTVLGSTVSANAQLHIRSNAVAAAQFDTNLLFNAFTIEADGTKFMANQAQPATPTGGGRLFVNGGALKYIGSGGTVTTIAIA
jgi:hypothetical protein